MSWDSLRLARLDLPAKLLITLFLAIVGPGYLFGTANILLKHQDADLSRVSAWTICGGNLHGMEKTVTPDAKITVHSKMLEQVLPGGPMAKYLEPGGEPPFEA